MVLPHITRYRLDSEVSLRFRGIAFRGRGCHKSEEETEISKQTTFRDSFTPQPRPHPHTALQHPLSSLLLSPPLSSHALQGSPSSVMIARTEPDRHSHLVVVHGVAVHFLRPAVPRLSGESELGRPPRGPGPCRTAVSRKFRVRKGPSPVPVTRRFQLTQTVRDSDVT